MESLTGCRKKSNPRVYEHQFKVAYTLDELNQCLTPPPPEHRDRSVSKNRSHFKEGMTLGDASDAFLGSSSSRCMITDRSSQRNKER